MTLTHMAALLGCVIPPVGHLLGPLIVWLAKRDQLPEINDTAKEALNFQITASLGYVFLYFVVHVITGMTAGIAAPFMWVLTGCYSMAHLVFTIGGILRVDTTGTHRYPYTVRILR
jgi:uncharacterized Tic20 family protein